jgi:hypothetical protein
MACPMCGQKDFFVKDPEDEYETFEFHMKDGEIVFPSETDGSECPEIKEQTRVYCSNCAWNGQRREIR